MDKQIIVYKPNDQVKMEVKTDGETVWLTQDQICRLFGRDQSVIARHIGNVFKEGELPKEGFMQILHKTSDAGGRPVALYNLDVVISVGYRVKSFEGTRFRQWATRALRNMLLQRLSDIRRIDKLESRMDRTEIDIKQIKGGMNYLVKQLSVPDAPRRKIGFDAKPGETSATPYGRVKRTVHSSLETPSSGGRIGRRIGRFD